MLASESVRATLTFWRIAAGESVRIIRDFSSACDLDILEVGSLRDITRLAGAGQVSVWSVPSVPSDMRNWYLTYQCLGDGENRPVEVVEAVRGISGKLQVLSLVFPNGDMGSSWWSLVKKAPM